MCYVSVKKPFDTLVLLVLSDQFIVKELFRVPYSELCQRLKSDKQGSYVNWSDIEPWRITRQVLQACEGLAAFLDLSDE